MKISKEVISAIKKGGIGVIPTDTLYGLVGQALNPETVERIYRARRRNRKKPLIIIISRLEDLSPFEISLKKKEKKILTRLWPGPISVILSCPKNKFYYLHRGQKSLAFRLPRLLWLRRLIEKTGPLVAPSANPEGKVSAQTIKVAKKYFGQQIDFYVDGGSSKGKPSTIVRLKDGQISMEREGRAGEASIRRISR
jgi:L-threonylcarbamoyladenylate synthase